MVVVVLLGVAAAVHQEAVLLAAAVHQEAVLLAEAIQVLKLAPQAAALVAAAALVQTTDLLVLHLLVAVAAMSR